MSKEKLLKQEKGSIAVFAIATVFSLIFILGGVFAASTATRKNQLRTLLKIKEIYLKDVELEKVARVGTIEYTTLQRAIDSVNNGEETTVYLLKDVKENVIIQKDKNIVLDMGGHKIEESNSEESTMKLEGTLKISDGTIASVSNSAIDNYGTIEISGNAQINNNGEPVGGNGTLHPCLENNSGATATITGGKITSTSSNAISNSGTIEISGTARIEGSTLYTVCVSNKSGATATISGGTISTENGVALGNYSTTNSTTGEVIKGKVTITGGEITSIYHAAINNYGIIEISGTAKISNNGKKEGDVSAGPCITNNSTVTISGGTISSENTNGLWNKSGATATITGGEITSTSSEAINNSGTIEIGGIAKMSAAYNVLSNKSGATATITGGKMTTTYSSAINNSGTINISGTTQISGSLTNLSGATATITGGEITGTTLDAINNSGTIKISGTAKIRNNSSYACFYNQSGATATISGGTITSEKAYGLWNYSGATATISGGTFTSLSSYAIYNKGTITSISGATINGKRYGI